MNEQENVPPQTGQTGQTGSPHQRLKELMTRPDNLMTEAQWDELIELEIAMAQGGRVIGNSQKGQQHQANQGIKNAKPHGGGGGGGNQPRKPARKFHKKPAKPAAPSA